MPTPDGKIKVLIADGSELIRIYFQDIFWINGFESCCELSSASDLDETEAIVADPKTTPDVIFLGLSLRKNVDGRAVTDPKYSFEFAHRLKSDPVLKRIKIFIFSSHMEKQFEQDAADSKVDKYIYKDQNLPKDLVAIISSFTGSCEPAPSSAVSAPAQTPTPIKTNGADH
jgi:DNA-binding NarL/FixJ family response regulator